MYYIVRVCQREEINGKLRLQVNGTNSVRKLKLIAGSMNASRQSELQITGELLELLAKAV